MKPYLPLLCAAALCAVLAGCTSPTPAATASPTPAATATPAPPPVTPSAEPAVTSAPYTKESALSAFESANASEGLTGLTAGEVVLLSGAPDGLSAAVLYTDENLNSACNLAFLYGDNLVQRVSFASNDEEGVRAFTPEAGTLSDDGNSTVSVTVLENSTQIRYRFSITGVRAGDLTDFSVNSDILS